MHGIEFSGVGDAGVYSRDEFGYDDVDYGPDGFGDPGFGAGPARRRGFGDGSAPGCYEGCTCARPRPLTAADRLAAAQQTATILSRALTGAYERGWQPGDILHVTSRHMGLTEPGALVALVLAHAYRFDAPARAPWRWADELRGLALSYPAADAAARRYTALIEPRVHSPACDCPRCCVCRSRCEDSEWCACADSCRWCSRCSADGEDPFTVPGGGPDPFTVLFSRYHCGVYEPLGDRPSRLPQLEERLWRRLSDRSGHKLSLHAVLLVWDGLPQWPHLCPPPSQWGCTAMGGPSTAQRGGATNARVTGAYADAPESNAHAPKVLERIQGLLTKAESTQFPEEAEALAAKAQELITRHAVDAALLRGRADASEFAVCGRRIHLHNPYLREKVRLLSEIGFANCTRTVWSKPLAIATIVGPAAELDQVELLYNSLLLQVTRAMRDRTPNIARQNIMTFRSSFLTGFATRVGERLADARDRAASAAAGDANVTTESLLPVMRAREEAVRRETDKLFPHTEATRAGRVDPHGWLAGKDAADDATITAGGSPDMGRGALPTGRAAG